MDQRVALIGDWLRDEWTITELADRYGVTRKTVHKWIGRYGDEAAGGLLERSRAPHHHGRAHAESVREAVVALRRAHPHRGPKKLLTLLPKRSRPAASTVGTWLHAAGLTTSGRRRRHIVPLTQPLAAATAPNDVWTADFKGWFRTTDGTRCDPLTVLDACSRYVLCCRIVAPTEVGVRPALERTSQEFGVPAALRTDNGTPFASTGAARLTRLAVWLLKLGIQLDRIDPGHPEQNGRHERFHLTLQQEAVTPPAATPAAQQRRFDRMVQEFNADRPHEALGQRPPASVYRASRRPYPARLIDVTYDAHHQVRRVSQTGQIYWQGEQVFVSEAVRGELVGVAETERGDWTVRFMQIELGRIAHRTRRFAAAWHGRRVGGTTNRVLPM